MRFLFQILESESNLYLVMEYAKGGELFDYIVKKNQLALLLYSLGFRKMSLKSSSYNSSM